MPHVVHGRQCATCHHQVIDVANLPEAEGRQTLVELSAAIQRDPTRRICVRSYAYPSGRLVASRRKLLTHSLVSLFACTMAGCVGDGPQLVNTQPLSTTQQNAQETITVLSSPSNTPKPVAENCHIIMGKFAMPKSNPQPAADDAQPTKDSNTLPPEKKSTTMSEPTIYQTPTLIIGEIIPTTPTSPEQPNAETIPVKKRAWITSDPVIKNKLQMRMVSISHQIINSGKPSFR